MDSWRCVSEDKGFLSDELNSATDSLWRNKHSFSGWESRNQCDFGDSLLVSGQQHIDNHGFGGLGSPQMVVKQVPDSSIVDSMSSKVSKVGGGRIMNQVMHSSNDFLREDESISKLSGSVVDSYSRESSLIDLKLGRFADQWDSRSYKFSKGAPLFSSSGSSTPLKRIRASTVNSQSPSFCQVYGCNKDLSSSKDYHKRHKVCEVHSKTSKVIVNGIEQRFCQQCSRFHLLAEFDDGKRSCRKRLAGHNQRRRKPQVGISSGRPGRLLQSYNGILASRFLGTTLAATSFTCREILPSGLLLPEKYDMNDWFQQIKAEGKDYRSLSTNGHQNSKYPFPPCDIEKQYSSFHENGSNISTANMFNETNSQYPINMENNISSSHSLFNDTSLGSEGLNVYDAASTVQGLSKISDSGCALSLLSSQSHNSSSHSSGIPMTRPLVMPNNQSNYRMSQLSMKSAEGCQLGPILTSESSDLLNYDIMDGIFRGSDLASGKDHPSCEGSSPTIDLLQLSSQLQRIDHQRQSMQVKQESNTFCSLRIT